MYCEGATVKNFKDALEEMRKVYDYKDEETRVCIVDERGFAPNSLSITTVDEKTEIKIMMTKRLAK